MPQTKLRSQIDNCLFSLQKSEEVIFNVPLSLPRRPYLHLKEHQRSFVSYTKIFEGSYSMTILVVLPPTWLEANILSPSIYTPNMTWHMPTGGVEKCYSVKIKDAFLRHIFGTTANNENKQTSLNVKSTVWVLWGWRDPIRQEILIFQVFTVWWYHSTWATGGCD